MSSCSDGNSNRKTDPEVSGAYPLNKMTAVPINHKITATFSESMDEVILNEMSFLVSGGLTQENGTSIIREGGAQVKNIFWQVAGGTGVAIGTHAAFKALYLPRKALP